VLAQAGFADTGRYQDKYDTRQDHPAKVTWENILGSWRGVVIQDAMDAQGSKILYFPKRQQAVENFFMEAK
jgi:hypothetical protein